MGNGELEHGEDADCEEYDFDYVKKTDLSRECDGRCNSCDVFHDSDGPGCYTPDY